MAVVAGSAEVVGQLTSKAGVGTPAVWSGAPPAPTSLLTSIPDATAGSAWSLDGGGDIVGQVTMGGLARAFYLPADGNPTILPTLASGSASSAVAKGVNAAGQVVGYSNCSATGVINHAFVWTSAGGMVNLGDFTGNAATPLASGCRRGQLGRTDRRLFLRNQRLLRRRDVDQERLDVDDRGPESHP